MANPPELGPLLAVGRTAEVFAWGQGQILKLYQHWVWPGDADHEIAMTQAVEAVGLPMARCLGRKDLNGRPGVLFERVVGASLLDSLFKDPSRGQEIAQMLGRLHASMHAVSAPALPSLRPRLADRIRQAAPLNPRWRQAAIDRLERLPDGDALCHGDFHPGNVLLAEAGPVIIDWIDVASGHPLADMARTVALIRYGEAPSGPAAEALTPPLRAAFLEAYLAAYRALRPAPQSDLDQWLPVILAARLAEDAENDQSALISTLAAAFGPPGS